MKKITLAVAAFLVIFFVSCTQTEGIRLDNKSDHEIWSLIESVLAEGANPSDIRPHADTLSEKEVLIKFAKIAASEGYLAINHPLYTSDQPGLLNARIEEPVLVYDVNVPAIDAYRSASYMLTAVDDKGEMLLTVFVNTSISPSEKEHGPISVTPNKISSELSMHYITEREAKKLIERQFPGQEYRGPIAVRMAFEGDIYSKNVISWYFSVPDIAARPPAGDNESGEYLIQALVKGFRELNGQITDSINRGVVDTPKSNPGFTFRSRMAQLVEPIRFLEKLDAVKEGGSMIITDGGSAPGPALLIPVPLK
jgi:hypothetical protein